MLCLSRCSIKQSHKKESKSFKVKTGFIVAIAITSTSLQVQQFSGSINAEFLFQRSILFFVTTQQMCKEWENSLAGPEETFNTGEYIFNRHSNMSHKLPPGLWELTGLGRANYSVARSQKESIKTLRRRERKFDELEWKYCKRLKRKERDGGWSEISKQERYKDDEGIQETYLRRWKRFILARPLFPCPLEIQKAPGYPKNWQITFKNLLESYTL